MKFPSLEELIECKRLDGTMVTISDLSRSIGSEPSNLRRWLERRGIRPEMVSNGTHTVWAIDKNTADLVRRARRRK